MKAMYMFWLLHQRRFMKWLGLSKRIQSKNGVIIVITGPDGSGKTSLISNLKSSLDNRIRIKEIKFSPIFNKKSSIKGNKESNRYLIYVNNLIKINYYLFWMFWRVILTNYCSFLKSLGFIIICDRYLATYNSPVDGGKINLLIKSPSIFTSLERYIHRFSRKADIEVSLKTSLNTVIQRNNLRIKENKETSLEIKRRYIEAKQTKYLVNSIFPINNDGLMKLTLNQLTILILNIKNILHK